MFDDNKEQSLVSFIILKNKEIGSWKWKQNTSNACFIQHWLDNKFLDLMSGKYISMCTRSIDKNVKLHIKVTEMYHFIYEL